jgi:hypothetical protein
MDAAAQQQNRKRQVPIDLAGVKDPKVEKEIRIVTVFRKVTRDTFWKTIQNRIAPQLSKVRRMGHITSELLSIMFTRIQLSLHRCMHPSTRHWVRSGSLLCSDSLAHLQAQRDGELEQFRSHFDDVKFHKGMDIRLALASDGSIITIVDGSKVPLCPAFPGCMQSLTC